MDRPGEDKAQPGGRDRPAGGTGMLRCEGTAGMGRRVLGASGRYLGAVEVTAVCVGEPARPAGALVDGHVPQLDVHPHDTPGQRDGVKPQGCVEARRAPHPVRLVLVHGLVGQCKVSAASPDPRWGLSPPWSCIWGKLELGQGKGRRSYRGALTQPRERGAAGVASACCPAPRGINSLPWVL